MLPLACDVSDLKALERMVATCKGRLGPVQILINNAGIETANRVSAREYRLHLVELVDRHGMTGMI